MARAFTPSRSAIYGAPDRQAMIGVANTLSSALDDWSEEEIQGEYRRQVSNASVAMEKERQGLAQFMRDNQRDPSAWKKQFAQNREKIRKGVLDGLTQPQAKQTAELELNESLQQWEGWINDNASKQTAINTNADYETGLAGFYESHEYADETDVMSRLSAGLTHIDHGFNGGQMPVDSLPNQEAAEAEKRKLARQVLGDFGLQQALAGGNEEWLDTLNDRAKGVFDGDPLFGPDDLAKVKKQFTAASNAAKTEANTARSARAEAFERDTTLKLLRGEFTAQDEKGNSYNLRDAILNNPDLSPEKIRTLENLYQEQAKPLKKPYDETGKLAAYIAIRSETDPKKKLDLLKEHAQGLGFNEVQSLYDKMTDPTSDDSHLSQGLDKTISAMRKVRITNTTTEEDDIKTESELLRLQNKVLRTWDAHPDWTEGQKIDEMEKLLLPSKNEAAKKTVKSLWERLTGGGVLVPPGPQRYGSWAPLPPETSEDKAPAGLEGHWSKLTPERRQKVKNLLAKGIPLNRIVEALEK